MGNSPGRPGRGPEVLPDHEHVLTLSMKKQLNLLAHVLESNPVSFRTVKWLQLFNDYYHPKKTVMISESAFNKAELISLLVDKFLHTDHKDRDLKVAVITQSVHMLGLLAREDGARFTIIQQNAVSQIVQSMTVYRDVLPLVEHCLFALGNLALHSDGKEEIMRLEGVGIIVDIMRIAQDAPAVLERACFTLGNLAYHQTCKQVLIEHEGVPLAIAIAKQHTNRPALLLEACFFFSNMSVIEEGRHLIIDHGGVEFIIECMREQQQQIELLDLACSALYNISLDDFGKEKLDELNALEVVVLSLKNNISKPLFIVEVLNSICRIFLDNDIDLGRLVEAGAVKTILEAKKLHRSDPGVSATSSLCLSQISNYVKTYEKRMPVMSLRESCARAVLNSTSLELASKSYEKVLPADLIHYLGENQNKCDACERGWVESSIEAVTLQLLDGFPKKLPVLSRVCSEKCLQTIKRASAAVPKLTGVVPHPAHAQ
eukprot:TRINITY_DN1026_c0_g1_i2.p1 TRINITY_DN1026_c0_g1~~TRINITY_DN1026_c0_g1_i2.p1  ORF type:complete len:487 (+),score=67.82 TRINITY_DN1026_c0_g1_i2:561-2021(+)